MVFDNVWDVWPFREYFSTTNSRRHNRQSSRCGDGAKGHSEPLIKLLGPWESKMVALQSILIWEKPGTSAVTLIAANIVYWSMAFSEVKFFFGISIFGLAAFLSHQWIYLIWPEISVPKAEQEDWTPVHPSVLSAPEVSRYLNNIWTYIQGRQKRIAQLRRTQPGRFCTLMMVIFSLLWLLGRVVSGVTLLYTLLMAVMCGPAFIFRFVPKSFFKKTEQIYGVIFGKKDNLSQNDEKDLEEFLPEETSQEAQTALGIPLTTHELKDELEESVKSTKVKSKVKSRRGKSKLSLTSEVGNSFTIGLSESDFPSLEDTTDTLEESDLALPEEVVDSKVSTIEAGMHFVSTHFGDSSDEDEEFAMGLTFNRNPQPVYNTQGYGEEHQAPRESEFQSVYPNFMNLLAQELPKPYYSIGEQLASAIGSKIAAALNPSKADEDRAATPTNDELVPTDEDESAPAENLPVQASDDLVTPTNAPTDISKVANSESSEEEDFELISDDDLQ